MLSLPPYLKPHLNLILRVITATILIMAVIAALFYLPLTMFNVIAALIMLLGAWELAIMFWPQSLLRQTLFLAAILVVAVTCFSFSFLANAGVLMSGMWWIIVPLFLARYVKQINSAEPISLFNDGTKYVTGILVFVPFFLALSILQSQFGPSYLLYSLVLVWANDVGAYFSGTFFGKNLLAPAISPKKTIEGAVGGVILGTIIIITGGFLLKVHGIKWILWFMLSIIVSLWSIIGDLFESMLKRQAQVKDSGNLLPGHGGIYDRVDSLTAALPIFVLGMLYCGF